LIFIARKILTKIKQTKKKFNLLKGKITYSDLNKPGKPLYSKRYRISGKPDYVINTDGKLIPVEIKTGFHQYPQQNHIFQLAAYCQILEDNFNCFIPFGLLIYNDSSKKFKIRYDPKMRYDLESTLAQMRHIRKLDDLTRNHNDLKKCKKCSMRVYCSKKII
jgi:CRISPR-associated exonuclease Cas4